MELPASGPYIFSPQQPPAAAQPLQFNVPLAFTPLTNVSLSSDEPRIKLRRVTKEDGGNYARIPSPYESKEKRVIKRYQAFVAQYPSLYDQLVALRKTLDEHEVREELIFDLIESGKIDEALPFYLEMNPCESKKEFLTLYCRDLAKLDQVEKAISVVATVFTYQPHVFEIFILELAHAFVDSNQIPRAIEIYDKLQTKKTNLLLYIFKKISKPFIKNPQHTVTELNQLFPQAMKEELFFVMGTALVKFKRQDLIHFFIDFMTTRRAALLELVKNSK